MWEIRFNFFLSVFEYVLMACFRFRAQSQLPPSTQDFQSSFALDLLSDLDLDVVSSSLFELSCVGISGSEYAGTKFSVFFISENPTSIEFEIRSSESQFSRINRAMLLTRALYKKAEADYVCTPIMPSVLV